ncbi:hypothetical protein [Pectobacterium parmentieri]|uniref:Uncharacterized protein n=1 Tax=Pectobacterium parmentieri TaxID=1905730 RepID=A0A8B3FG95_PECPM|nr:hypothetical protein [Pectobacterium parmentieri]PWD67507.1 hypothetical protein DF211_01270 [Pectobacterium parmentieri]RKO78441.1 hypothetical protein C5E00_17450 [Pectobacterium parmentieri]
MITDKDIAKNLVERYMSITNDMYDDVNNLQGKIPDEEHKELRKAIGNIIVDIFDNVINRISEEHKDIILCDINDCIKNKKVEK